MAQIQGQYFDFSILWAGFVILTKFRLFLEGRKHIKLLDVNKLYIILTLFSMGYFKNTTVWGAIIAPL